jgi:transposase-like protein
MGIFRKDINKGAYQGRLTCPLCESAAIRFVENIGPFRLRYRCRKCGAPFQYETGRDMSANPYAPFNKNKWRNIVDAHGRNVK